MTHLAQRVQEPDSVEDVWTAPTRDRAHPTAAGRGPRGPAPPCHRASQCTRPPRRGGGPARLSVRALTSDVTRIDFLSCSTLPLYIDRRHLVYPILKPPAIRANKCLRVLTLVACGPNYQLTYYSRKYTVYVYRAPTRTNASRPERSNGSTATGADLRTCRTRGSTLRA